MIHRLAAEGMGVKTIAREIGADPKTVRGVLKPKPRKVEPRPSLLDPYRPLIRKLVLDDELTAVRVHEEIAAAGYTGRYSILKEFIRTFRPKAIRRPHLRFETEPGEQGQVDLSPYTVLLGEAPTPVVCFSLILGFSRWQSIRFVLHADVRSVCHSHVLAFEEAGGVPHEILYDRMKQVVLDSTRDGVLYHPLFERMMQHYGFRAVPLAPGYKEGKGKVENPFRYVEGNFLAGRTFHSIEDLNEKAARWLAETARVRIHRTTCEAPAVRLDRERPALLPLPERRFDAAEIVPRVVGDDFCVAWETNRYSVPPRLAGQTVWVHVLEGQLEVHGGGDIVVRHVIRTSKHKRYVLPEHEAEFRSTSSSRHVLEDQFQRLGPNAAEFVAGLKELKGGSAGYHMGQILQLADRVGAARVVEALRHAVRYRAFDHRTVARIVGAKPARRSTPSPTGREPEHIDQYLRGAGSHQRGLERYRGLTAPTDPPKKKKKKKKDPEEPDGE